jgi:hypothetical protein
MPNLFPAPARPALARGALECAPAPCSRDRSAARALRGRCLPRGRGDVIAAFLLMIIVLLVILLGVCATRATWWRPPTFGTLRCRPKGNAQLAIRDTDELSRGCALHMLRGASDAHQFVLKRTSTRRCRRGPPARWRYKASPGRERCQCISFSAGAAEAADEKVRCSRRQDRSWVKDFRATNDAAQALSCSRCFIWAGVFFLSTCMVRCQGLLPRLSRCRRCGSVSESANNNPAVNGAEVARRPTKTQDSDHFSLYYYSPPLISSTGKLYVIFILLCWLANDRRPCYFYILPKKDTGPLYNSTQRTETWRIESALHEKDKTKKIEEQDIENKHNRRTVPRRWVAPEPSASDESA